MCLPLQYLQRVLRVTVKMLPAIAVVSMVLVLLSAAATAAEPASGKKKHQQPPRKENARHSGNGSNSGSTPERLGPGSVRIVSPDTEQTFAQFSILSQRLSWSRSSQQLTADITFSNVNYASRNIRREDELYYFRFPGVQLDPATNILYARAKNGNRVVIGRYVNQILGGSIRFAPSAHVVIYNDHGRVKVVLVADNYGSPVDLHWQVSSRAFSFRNLLD